MKTRRNFLKQLSLTSAGLGLLHQPMISMAQSPHRIVKVGGKAVKVIDIHAHCVIPEVIKLTRGTEFEKLGMASWQTLGPKRLTDMDERGIDIQVLSINRYWWYGANRELASKVVRFHDEMLAKWSKDHPGRFVALSSVALQYPDLAAEQLEYAVKELGHKGASIGTSVNGEQMSSARFDPFWAKCEELQVPIFMHPGNDNEMVNPASLQGSGDLNPVIRYPFESTVFLAHMIFDGTLDKFPGLRICISHGGGYLPSYVGRIDAACDVRPDADCKNTRKPSEYLKDQVLVDSMVFSVEGLRHLVAEVGVGQVVYGTDIPFNWPDTIDVILNTPTLTNADKEAILGGNLAKLLKI
jgi:aminocarboxymuconate-semialdehyde decarboxylase